MYTNFRQSKVLFSVLLFFILTINAQAVFAQNPSLDRMDRLYKESKSKQEYEKIALLIEKILRYNLSRSDCIIAFGGGITGDLSAFVSNLMVTQFE